MISRRSFALGAVAGVHLPAPATAQRKSPPAASAKPKLPPGRDPGGVAIAIIGAGVDYTRPEIAARLARDGEGDLIGWDFIDNDNRPFTKDHHPTLLPHVAAAPAVRLVPLRVSPDTVDAIGQALVFLKRTPARIAIVLDGRVLPQFWKPFDEFVAEATDLLLIVPSLRAHPRPSLVPDNAVLVTAVPQGRYAMLVARKFNLSNFDAGPAPQDIDVALTIETTDAERANGTRERDLAWEDTAAVRLAGLCATLIAREPVLAGPALKQRLLALAKPAPRAARHGVIEAP